MKLKRLMSKSEYARHAGVSESRVRQWCQAGLPLVRAVPVAKGIVYCEGKLRRRDLKKAEREALAHGLGVLKQYRAAGLKSAPLNDVLGDQGAETY
jgi:hypothetical protein